LRHITTTQANVILTQRLRLLLVHTSSCVNSTQLLVLLLHFLASLVDINHVSQKTEH